jgi:hypothetical protein
MTTCPAPPHSDHAHQHGPGCGHSAVRHGGHTDYLHDGHLHHPHEGHVDEHVIEVSRQNPDSCTSDHRCGGHDGAMSTGPDAATMRCRTATMWTIGSPAIFTIRTAITATTTVPWRLPRGERLSRHRPGGCPGGY